MPFTGESTANVGTGTGIAVDVATPSGTSNQREVVALGSASHSQDVPITRASNALGALNTTVTLPLWGLGSVVWQIDVGTLVGTIVFEYTLDDANWLTLPVTGIQLLDGTPMSSASLTSFATQQTGFLILDAVSQIRMRVSAYTSGTVNARMLGSLEDGYVRIERTPKGIHNTKPAVSVGTTPTLLLAANSARKAGEFFNNGSVTMFYGDATVTTTNGLPVVPGALGVDGDSVGPIYGIVASGTVDCRVAEIA